MPCLRTLHRGLIYSLFSVFAVLFLSLFGFVSPSFATSQSFTYDSVNNPVPSYLNPDNIGFNPHYFEMSGSVEVADGFQPLYQIRCGFYSGDSPAVLVHSYNFYEFRSLTCFENNMNSIFMPNSRLSGSTYSFTITFYDDFPDNSEPCPVCPEIPDDSQTLVDIKHAIYFIPAVLLLIYFFYIMFGWYMGVRR